MTKGNVANGAGYLLSGFQLLTHRRLLPFVIVPVLINIALFIVLTTVFVQQFENLISPMLNWLPDWLDFLAWIAGILVALVVVLIYGYCFSILTNLIAAPFYGQLAEKAEEVVSGHKLIGETWSKMIPRTFARELSKILYFSWRSLLVFILLFVPVVGPFIGFAWGAWCMAIQYTDYAMDNHRTPFRVMRSQLSERLLSSMGFGGLVTLGMMVPLLNILVMPAAVIGGTIYWLEEVDAHRI